MLRALSADTADACVVAIGRLPSRMDVSLSAIVAAAAAGGSSGAGAAAGASAAGGAGGALASGVGAGAIAPVEATTTVVSDTSGLCVSVATSGGGAAAAGGSHAAVGAYATALLADAAALALLTTDEGARGAATIAVVRVEADDA